MRGTKAKAIRKLVLRSMRDWSAQKQMDYLKIGPQEYFRRLYRRAKKQYNTLNHKEKGRYV